MTTVVIWPDRDAPRHAAWGGLLRRLDVSVRLWGRRRARRRFVNQVLAETRDPRILGDLGISTVPQPDVERWVTAILWHQH
jgi:hypothetical protein